MKRLLMLGAFVFVTVVTSSAQCDLTSLSYDGINGFTFPSGTGFGVNCKQGDDLKDNDWYQIFDLSTQIGTGDQFTINSIDLVVADNIGGIDLVPTLDHNLTINLYHLTDNAAGFNLSNLTLITSQPTLLSAGTTGIFTTNFDTPATFDATKIVVVEVVVPALEGSAFGFAFGASVPNLTYYLAPVCYTHADPGPQPLAFAGLGGQLLLRLNGSCSAVIPTMGQWSLLIFGMLLSILGTVYILVSKRSLSITS